MPYVKYTILKITSYRFDLVKGFGIKIYFSWFMEKYFRDLFPGTSEKSN